VVAPRVVRPAEKIRISCTVLNKYWTNLKVKALIYTDEQEIVSGEQEFLPMVPNTIAMVMPNNIRQGNYHIRVEGKLPTGELKFHNVSNIIFQQKAVSILIQLEKPDYRQEALLRFRCIPIYPDLSAYYGTMDVFVVGPHGMYQSLIENNNCFFI
jgi:CD109 antigen